MKPHESLEVRKEMVDMHAAYLQRLDAAMKNEQYVEASWLCYAIFEQRINRLVVKYLDKCPLPTKKGSVPIAISTRIRCIENLIKHNYGGFAEYDKTLLPDIKNWCHIRNTLVHGLIGLDKYKKYDEEFENLAKKGQPLVKRIYSENEKYRIWFMGTDKLPDFPEYKCKCKTRCIKE